jgi:hypothetical protein
LIEIGWGHGLQSNAAVCSGQWNGGEFNGKLTERPSGAEARIRSPCFTRR